MSMDTRLVRNGLVSWDAISDELDRLYALEADHTPYDREGLEKALVEAGYNEYLETSDNPSAKLFSKVGWCGITIWDDELDNWRSRIPIHLVTPHLLRNLLEKRSVFGTSLIP